MKVRVRIGYAIIIATYLATELSVLFGCHPFSNNWQIYPDPGSEFGYFLNRSELQLIILT